MRASRWVGLAIVVVAVIVSLIRFVTGTPSVDALIRVVVWILAWAPVKGALLRFLGGARPYRSALAANASSELIGLGFPVLGLGLPWRALAASLVCSTGFEGLALGAMGTAASWKRSFGMALYANVFVHLLMTGIFFWRPDTFVSVPVFARQPLLGVAIIFVSFLVFILPIFLVSRPPTTDFGRR